MSERAVFWCVWGILRWFASIWLDFGIICGVWEYFVMFGGEAEWLEMNKRSLEMILGRVAMNLWPSKTIRWSFGWNSGDRRQLGAVYRRFALIGVVFVAKKDNLRRRVMLQGDSGKLWDKLATSFDDLSEVWNNFGESGDILWRLLMEFDVLETICWSCRRFRTDCVDFDAI